MANEVAEKKVNSEIMWMQEQFLPMLEEELKTNNAGKIDDYGKQCALSGIDAIYTLLHNQGIKATEINSSNIKPLLSILALYHINPASGITGNRECYFQIRNKNVAKKGQPEKWEKQLELNLETAGYEALISRNGRNVKMVHPKWVVREKDLFELPKHRGLEITPPVWEPVPNAGKVVCVILPIEYEDGRVEFHFSERADTRKNLLAHLNNNLMNETFGLAANRYNATPAEREKIEAKKKEIMDLARSKETIEDILATPELAEYISSSWTDNTESMVTTKMLKNIVVKIPKETAGIYSQHNATKVTEDGFAATVVADVEYREVKDEPKPFNQAVKAVADKSAQQSENAAAPY